VFPLTVSLLGTGWIATGIAFQEIDRKAGFPDNAATTQPAPEVVEAIQTCFRETYGNPSSLHSLGLEARGVIESARRNMAAFINAQPDELIFTGSGTECNNTVIKGIAQSLKDKGNHIITSAIEHHAILEPLQFLEKQGFKVTYLPNDTMGLVDPDDLRKAITRRTVLVSVMHANNEIGTIEPIKALGAICRKRGVYFHTDAVQTFGHIPIDVGNDNRKLITCDNLILTTPNRVYNLG